MKNLLCTTIFVSLFCLLLAVPIYYTHGTVEIVQIVVSDKERIVTGNGDSLSSKYLVFTDAETFQNTDSLFHLKFNSSDVQGRLKVGLQYSAKVYGWRVPFLSMYRNIVTTTPAS